VPQYTPLWTSILRSPKVFALEPDAFRFWVLCLALAQEHDRIGGELPGLESVAFALRTTTAEARRLAAVLIDAGFLDGSDDGGLMIHDWRDWRKVDPTATARKQRQRDKDKDQSQPGGGHVTRDIRDKRDTRDAGNHVTRDIRDIRDMKPHAMAKGAAPLRIARKTPDTAMHADKPACDGGKPADVTRDMRDTRDSPCHAYSTVHTEQDSNPLPPKRGGDGVTSAASPNSEPEPFDPTPEAPPVLPATSPAAASIIDRAAELWGAGGHDWAAELLRTFPPEVVQYGARETLRMLNGRPYGSGASKYWRTICQNHRDGPPVENPSRPGGRASPGPKYAPTPTDLTAIYHPSKLARMGLETNDVSGDARPDPAA